MSTRAYDYGPGSEPVVTETETYGRGREYGREDARVFGLVRRLAEEITTLFTKELALLKAETTSAIHDTRSGITSMAVGGAVLYAGLLFLLTAAMLALALVMDAWLAALIVGGVVTIIGAIMLASGKRKLEPGAFKPEHTAASMQKDRESIKRNVQESRERGDMSTRNIQESHDRDMSKRNIHESHDR